MSPYHHGRRVALIGNDTPMSAHALRAITFAWTALPSQPAAGTDLAEWTKSRELLRAVAAYEIDHFAPATDADLAWLVAHGISALRENRQAFLPMMLARRTLRTQTRTWLAAWKTPVADFERIADIAVRAVTDLGLAA